MKFDDSGIDAAAQRMLADYDAATPGTLFAQGLRMDVDQALRLQDAVTNLREARGEQVIGYKTGCVFEGNQKLMGLSHPVWGRLWQSELHANDAYLSKSSYANIAIEAEFGITLSRDLKPGLSFDELVSCVDAVYPLLELHNLVMRGEEPHGPELIANNCINCGVVRGASITDLDAPCETDLKLIYDGTVVDEWQSLRWPEDILASMSWLVESFTDRGMQLKRGDFILTGAWGPPIPVQEHNRVDVTSSFFGNASGTFS